tara:strand:+ start:95 stop:568 length:474 start_codon:yes stop_codon:yes gene_type:complete
MPSSLKLPKFLKSMKPERRNIGSRGISKRRYTEIGNVIAELPRNKDLHLIMPANTSKILPFQLDPTFETWNKFNRKIKETLRTRQTDDASFFEDRETGDCYLGVKGRDESVYIQITNREIIESVHYFSKATELQHKLLQKLSKDSPRKNRKNSNFQG